MIKKFAHIELGSKAVGDIFSNIAGWPGWMPGVKNLDVLDSREGYSRVAISQRFHGRTFNQELECEFSETGVAIRQLKGFFQKLQANWRFLTPPDGLGTTIKCEIDVKVGGMAGWVASKWMIDSLLDDYFRKIISALEMKGHALNELATTTDQEVPAGDILLQVFQTEHGLEMWLDGQLYSLTPKT